MKYIHNIFSPTLLETVKNIIPTSCLIWFPLPYHVRSQKENFKKYDNKLRVWQHKRSQKQLKSNYNTDFLFLGQFRIETTSVFINQ